MLDAVLDELRVQVPDVVVERHDPFNKTEDDTLHFVGDSSAYELVLVGTPPDGGGPLTIDEVDADALIGNGQPVSWSDLGAVVAASELLDRPVPEGLVVVYDELSVRRGDTRYPVAWWVTDEPVEQATDGALIRRRRGTAPVMSRSPRGRPRS
ncbi:hypothetical protein [Kutzneria sp. NPDC051319]|uniref:hypothetical protein n=1 Tax=Kutzneria sp. NPDC051319 TaxID=3155047 RepID=UPI0034395C62